MSETVALVCVCGITLYYKFSTIDMKPLALAEGERKDVQQLSLASLRLDKRLNKQQGLTDPSCREDIKQDVQCTAQTQRAPD